MTNEVSKNNLNETSVESSEEVAPKETVAEKKDIDVDSELLVGDLDKAELRQALHGSKRGRGRSDAEKKLAYKNYHERKAKVFEFERTNYSFLVLFAASDKDVSKLKFYNMGGNSAVIYVHDIAPRINKKAVLRNDNDSGEKVQKFRTGITSVTDLVGLEEKLKKLGIKRVKTRDEFVVMFKLARVYTEGEVKEMIKDENKRIETLNALLYSKVLFPDIHRLIIDLKKFIPPKVKNMNSVYRDIVGRKMIDSLMEVVRAYTEMAHGDLDEAEAARRMLREIDMILALTSMFSELKLWDIVGCIRIANTANGAKQLIKGKILNKIEEEK
ncbi:hypothetical protein IJJ39_00555 [Candidatus Saccharibacteria bacterium]|nr:hypothetical protein [Candidatus Saccharibacteria bacterium]